MTRASLFTPLSLDAINACINLIFMGAQLHMLRVFMADVHLIRLVSWASDFLICHTPACPSVRPHRQPQTLSTRGYARAAKPAGEKLILFYMPTLFNSKLICDESLSLTSAWNSLIGIVDLHSHILSQIKSKVTKDAGKVNETIYEVKYIYLQWMRID